MSAPVVPEAEKKLSETEQNFVVSFVQFLRQKVSANECNNEQIEAVEVAIQCLEGAFDLNDGHYAFQPAKALFDVFKKSEEGDANQGSIEQQKVEANKLKEEGNDLMKAGNFNEAVEKYNGAIKLSKDPVYFCNRAAAYCRLEQYDMAIQDCRTALALDPNYGKAYGRMGLALSCQNRYEQAVEAYKKALEIEPGQQSYINNLQIAEEKLKDLANAGAGNQGGFPFPGLGGLPGMAGMPGMPDISEVFNNPQMMENVTRMMSDPNIQNMMSQMMNNVMGAGAGPGAAAGGIEGLFAAGQNFAQQMQSSNPELVEQLRRQFQNTDTDDNAGQGAEGQENNEQQPPPSQ
uniref:SGTA_dimer domain-containing protein n=1 Tax=Steinernema glaseri TaxID=37863 RepID=A0A1I8A4G3_9BILA